MTEGLLAQMRRQQLSNQLGGLAQGLLNYDPRTPQSFGRTLGRAVGGFNAVPKVDPLQARMFDLQMKKLKAETSALEGGRPMSPAGKLARDLRKGLITQDQYDQAIQSRNRGRLESVGVGGSYKLPDGQEVQAFFDKKRKGHYYRDAEGVETPLPFGSTKITPSAELHDKMKPKAWRDFRNEMFDSEKAVTRMNRYVKNLKAGGQGLGLVGDKITGAFKTIFAEHLDSEGKLDTSEFATVKGRAQLQALLGQFRLETVGPGVMTEFDAQRVVWALGGNPEASRNKEVALSILKDVLQDRIDKYNSELDQFNRQGKRRRSGWKEKKPLKLDESLFEGIRSEKDYGLSGEEKASKKFDFGSMSTGELLKLHPDDVPDEQMEEYIKALEGV